MQITLHIGLEKTGTSTIQGFLKHNRDQLLEQRVLFPTSPGNANQTLLAAACMAEDINIRARALQLRGPGFEDTLKRDLQAEIDAAQPERLLLSNEHCSSRLQTSEEIEKLRDFLADLGEVTRVVVYLRRQDDFLLSTYSTAVKTGAAQPFRIPSARRMRPRYNYRKMLTKWSDVFGQDVLRPRLFQASSWVDGDLLSDFCDAIDVGVGDREIPSRNLALSAEGLELLRRLNAESTGARNGQVVRAVNALTKGPKLSMSTTERRAFMENFDVDNQWVAQTFFNRETLFDPVPDDVPENYPPEMTADRFETLRASVNAAVGMGRPRS